MKNRVLTLAAIAAVALGTASNAAAQAPAQPAKPAAPAAPAQPAAPAGPLTTTNPTWEVSGGYQWLYVDSSAPEPTNPIAPAEDEGTQFPFGLAVDGSRNFGAFGIVAEGGWSIRSEGDDPDDILFNFWHAGGGVRWTSRRNVTIWPYVQVLGGVAVQNTSGDIAGLDIGDTKAYPMIQPGGGVTFVVGDGWGIFGAGDYRRVFVDEEDGSALNEFRVFVGFRMILD